ncbi:MAG: asparagine synthase-related protein, partial [Steroidobacteraceae bacterium]
DSAAQTLRRTVRSCVHSWAQCYDSILIHLSGGLDSSIIAATLGSAPNHPKLTAINHFSRYRCGDERTYARLAAGAAGCTLIELPRNHSASLERLLSAEHTANPLLLRGRNVEFQDKEASIARDTGATASFGGEWGDGVFLQGAGLLPSVDYLETLGPRPELLSICYGLARLNGVSLWHVLFATFRGGSTWEPYRDMHKHRKLVAPHVIERARRSNAYVHPWLRSTEGLLPGKVHHLSYMSWPTPFYWPLSPDDSPEAVEPLISQPVIELSLAIPTYLHTAGGVDRAVARAAFAEDLPAEITNRYAKGRISTYVSDLLEHNHELSRELLLDGQLAAKGILRKEQLDEVLSLEPNPLGPSIGDILDYLTLEAWLRRWTRRPQMAVAM